MKTEVEEGVHLPGVGDLASPLFVDPPGRLESRFEGRPPLKPGRQPGEEVSTPSFVDQICTPPSKPERLAQGFTGPGNRQLKGEDLVEVVVRRAASHGHEEA